MKAFDLTPILNNFYNDIFESDERSDWEAYSLILIPGLFAAVGFYRQLDGGFVSTMSTSLAILFGFIFSSLLTTAKYSSEEGNIERRVVEQARIGTSYALLINLISLFTIVVISILVIDYSQLSYNISVLMSISVYFLLFHYLTVMIYLMRYLYLLAIGGAFEPPNRSSQTQPDEENESEITIIEQ
jgi:hypothetical protein